MQKIFNSATGRYVSPTGRVGKRIIKIASPKKKSFISPIGKSTSSGSTKKSFFSPISSIEITSPKKLSKGSKESIDILVDVACEELDSVRRSKLLGRGTEGSVYIHCILNNCNYVVKVQYDAEDPDEPPLYDVLRKEMKKTNIAHNAGLAPKIYKVLKCDKNILTLMDLVKGQTLAKEYSTLKGVTVDRLIHAIGRLHDLGIYHSDLNPQNIIVDNNKITFIDFGIRNKKYLKQYDFASLLYYMPSYAIQNDNITEFIYVRVVQVLRGYNDTVSKHIVSIWESDKIEYENKMNMIRDYILEKVYQDTFL